MQLKLSSWIGFLKYLFLKIPKNYTDLERTEVWGMRVAVVLFIIGSLLYLVPYSLSDSEVPYSSYTFQIQTRPSNNLNQFYNFVIFYDFEENTGIINSELYGTNNTGFIYLLLPPEVFEFEFHWSEDCNGNNKVCKIYRNGTDYILKENRSIRNGALEIMVDNLNNLQKPSKSIINLTFKGDLYPNAKIEIDPVSVAIIPPKGDHDGAFFVYSLGDKYKCYNRECVWAYRPEELRFGYGLSEGLYTVKVMKDKTGFLNIKYSLFYLQYALNQERKDFLFFLQLLGGFLASATLIGALCFFIWLRIKLGRKRSK